MLGINFHFCLCFISILMVKMARSQNIDYSILDDLAKGGNATAHIRCGCNWDKMIEKLSINGTDDLHPIRNIQHTSLMSGINYEITSIKYPGYRWKLANFTPILEENSTLSNRTFLALQLEPVDQQKECDPCSIFQFYSSKAEHPKIYLWSKCLQTEPRSVHVLMPVNNGTFPEDQGDLEAVWVDLPATHGFTCRENPQNFFCDQRGLLHVCVKEEDSNFYFGFSSFNSVEESRGKYIHTKVNETVELPKDAFVQTGYTETSQYQDDMFRFQIKPVCCDDSGISIHDK